MLTLATIRTGSILCLMVMILGCGEKSGPQIQLSFSGVASTAFSDPQVVDLVFGFTNIEANGQILDQDKDGQPDLFRISKHLWSSSACTMWV